MQAAVTFFRESGENLTYSEITSYAVAPDEEHRCEPVEERHTFYRELLGRQRGLGEILEGGGLSQG